MRWVILPNRHLINLEELDLEGNQITHLSPLLANTGLSNGDIIYLRDNPLSAIALSQHVVYLEERGVDVDLSMWR